MASACVPAGCSLLFVWKQRHCASGNLLDTLLFGYEQFFITHTNIHTNPERKTISTPISVCRGLYCEVK